LVETVRKSGLDQAISAALAPWRKARAVHDPGKFLLDVALAVALGGDCLADVGMLRAERVCVRSGGPRSDGMRLTCFAFNTRHIPTAALELRHRQRARAEDRIRAARATGLRNPMGHEAVRRRPSPELLSSVRRTRSPLHDGSTTMRNLASDASGQTVGIHVVWWRRSGSGKPHW